MTTPTSRPRRGLVAAEVLRRLAAHQLDGIDRAQLLKTYSTAKKRTNAAKVLGRMIRKGQVQERLLIDATHELNGLAGLGLVLVEVDIAAIRSEANNDETVKPLKHPKPGKRKPRDQDELMAEIVERTDEWLSARAQTGVPPIALVDCSIVHSAPFDIMVSVLFEEHRGYMAYVREVIQRTNFVSGTQTTFVARSLSATVPPGEVEEVGVEGSQSDE